MPNTGYTYRPVSVESHDRSDNHPEDDPSEDQENASNVNQINYSRRNSNNIYWIGRTHRFRVQDIIDVLDSSGHWCEAEILKIDHQSQKIFVTYLYWDSKFDEWIDNVDDRTAPFHTHTYYENGPVEVGQRVEAMDEMQIWRQAFIIEISSSEVKVHFHKFAEKYDLWIRLDSHKIRPYGKYSCNNVNKYPKNKLWRVPVPNTPYSETKENILENSLSVDTHSSMSSSRTRKIEDLSSQYNHYQLALARENLRIVQVPGDGNCLFRSVAHQIYGDNELHWLVRQRCMDYMEADSAFFSQFIEGGSDSFALYLQAKRTNACWGDDPEIQAVCEIYHRPAEIWAYDSVKGARKLRTFHEAASDRTSRPFVHEARPPIRLSYYGGGHYDSIVSDQFAATVLTRRPGEVEDLALAMVKQRLAHASAPNAILASDVEQTDRDAVSCAIEMSRRDIQWAQEDLESILALSMEVNAKDSAQSYEKAGDIIATQKELLSQVAETSENEFLEKAIISSVTSADESLLEQAQLESIVDPELDTVLELSKLSEEEALALAIKQSVNQVSAPMFPPIASTSSQTAAPSAFSQNAYIDDEEMLNAALAASLEDGAYNFPPIHSMTHRVPDYSDLIGNDDDEDMRRAIEESLKKR